MVGWQHSEVAAYAISIFTGAFLLFQVQPLIGKYLLPWFGGATGVWTTCILFFQLLLLGGYAYAHLSSRLLKPRNQAILHLALIAAALATLPITPSDAWKPHDASDPTLRIVALLTVSLGLPYFVLSGTAPLLQHWFSRAHPGVSPFRLYALSNTGSLLALLTYPTLFEVAFTRRQQALFWGVGLAVYAVAGVVIAVSIWRKDTSPSAKSTVLRQSHSQDHPAARQKAMWLLLPACASVLLLSITNKVCQDVAVIPFLWVLPLALYLLSFIICFEKPHWYRRWWSGPVLATAVLTLTCLLTGRMGFSEPIQIFIYSVGLFACCMVCHGEVYRLKPDPTFLTSFYLVIAAGGALGGIFVALIGPKVFPDYFELHWGLLACGVLFLLVLAGSRTRPTPAWQTFSFAAGWVLVAVTAAFLWQGAHRDDKVRVYRSRNFYGVLNVFEHENRQPELSLRELMHGRVAHGMQFLRMPNAGRPTLYYSERSGVGRALNLLPAGTRRVGIVGEGAGTIAVYGEKGDEFRFYEINPEVDHLAHSYFTYFSNSLSTITTTLGDARLSLESEAPNNFDLLVLDAFSSDAIPIHLLTREAFLVYERHLKTNGIIAVHVSNMTMNLEPVVVRMAQELVLSAWVIEHQETPDNWWILPSTWILISRDNTWGRNPLIREAALSPLLGKTQTPVWTDDFASLFPLLRWREFLGAGQVDAEKMARASVALEEKGDLAGAIESYKSILEQYPRFSLPLNNLAWLLAAVSDARLRNGTEAVKLAERACAVTHYRRTLFVGTLAAAYAEAGRFEEAIATAERACKMAEAAGERDLLKFNQRLLGYYRASQPYHEPGSTDPGK